MLWEVETDEYAATVKVAGLEFLRLESDSYGVEGSDFITHSGHEVLSIEFHYAEDYDILLKVTKEYYAICTDEFHTYYRVHRNNLTNTVPNQGVYFYQLIKFYNRWVD